MTKTKSRQLAESLRGHLAQLDRARVELEAIRKDHEIQALYNDGRIEAAQALIATRYPSKGEEIQPRTAIVEILCELAAGAGLEEWKSIPTDQLVRRYFDRVESIARRWRP